MKGAAALHDEEKLDFKPYQQGRTNGVSHYALVPQGIVLRYHDRNELYLYNNEKPGKHHVQQMIVFARKNEKLNTYINRHVRANYAVKW